MSVIDVIDARRSVRDFAPEPLDRDTIRVLLDAAVRAPTAVHEEPWAFVVVQDRVVLKRLSDGAKPLFLDEAHRAHLDRGGHALDFFRSPDFNLFYNAGTLIIIYGRGGGPFVAADCWLAAENLILAAHSIGLGTCVVGSALPLLNSAQGRIELGVPVEFTAIAPIIVGVPSGESPAVSRKAPHVLAWK